MSENGWGDPGDEKGEEGGEEPGEEKGEEGGEEPNEEKGEEGGEEPNEEEGENGDTEKPNEEKGENGDTEKPNEEKGEEGGEEPNEEKGEEGDTEKPNENKEDTDNGDADKGDTDKGDAENGRRDHNNGDARNAEKNPENLPKKELPPKDLPNIGPPKAKPMKPPRQHHPIHPFSHPPIDPMGLVKRVLKLAEPTHGDTDPIAIRCQGLTPRSIPAMANRPETRSPHPIRSRSNLHYESRRGSSLSVDYQRDEQEHEAIGNPIPDIFEQIAQEDAAQKAAARALYERAFGDHDAPETAARPPPQGPPMTRITRPHPSAEDRSSPPADPPPAPAKAPKHSFRL